MTSRTWTVRDVIQWSAGDFRTRDLDSPRLDAELLVAEALGTDRVGLYLDLDRPLDDTEKAAVRALVLRRREREPVAYILGYRDFFGHRFGVNEAVLIPRPDTETLVERALACIPEDEPLRVLDVGTGSGAVALSVAAARPKASVTATDVSPAALAVAIANAQSLGLTANVDFREADIVDDLPPFDVVVSNPPYVTREELAELEPEVRDHEPTLALVGGDDGLDVIRVLVDRVAAVTREGADLLVEVGVGQADRVIELASRIHPWASVASYPDLQGVDRVVHLRRT
ncbi:MAG: peptide chain release factor N(5)-glutamine methyltransferase [Myxococcota bacterium]